MKTRHIVTHGLVQIHVHTLSCHTCSKSMARYSFPIFSACMCLNTLVTTATQSSPATPPLLLGLLDNCSCYHAACTETCGIYFPNCTNYCYVKCCYLSGRDISQNHSCHGGIHPRCRSICPPESWVHCRSWTCPLSSPHCILQVTVDSDWQSECLDTNNVLITCS